MAFRKSENMARFLLLIMSTVFGAAIPSAVGQTDAPPATEQAAAPTVEPMTPSYGVADEERDPFFAIDNQFPQRPQAVLPKDPTAKDLLPLVMVSGLMGRPEDPKAAGILIDDNIHRVGGIIAIRYDGKTYELTLVSVVFPDKIILAYKDETVTLTIGKKN